MSAAIAANSSRPTGTPSNSGRSWPRKSRTLSVHSPAWLDGEICCLEPDGRTHFNKLLFRREWPFFYAFDVLSIEGEDLTGLPLLERKRRLLHIMPTIDCRLLYLDHIERRGCDLFRAACNRDLEGIVAKWAEGTYRTDGRATSWLKIKNREYSQMRDRHELFESRLSGVSRRRALRRPDLVLR